MARSTKGARNITVGNVRFRWRATGNDGWISISIWPSELPHPGIYGTLSYHETMTPAGEGRYHLENQIVVTNKIIRRAIDYAIGEHAFEASKKAKPLDLGRLDDKIDLSDAERTP